VSKAHTERSTSSPTQPALVAAQLSLPPPLSLSLSTSLNHFSCRLSTPSLAVSQLLPFQCRSLPLSLYPKHHTCNASCVTTLRATVDPFSPLGLWIESNTLGSRTRLCWPRRPHWDGPGPKATAVGRWICVRCRRLTAYLRSPAMIICRLGLRKSFLTAPPLSRPGVELDEPSRFRRLLDGRSGIVARTDQPGRGMSRGTANEVF
jgi:hypothetical protein